MSYHSVVQMGKVKARIMPEDITLNIGKDAPIPQCPVPGHK
jgi:DNA topoisomerase-1